MKTLVYFSYLKIFVMIIKSEKTINMEKYGVYKLIDYKLELCIFFDTVKEATDYLIEVKKEVMYSFQNELKGDYVIIPSIYFKIDNEEKI